MCWWHCMWFLTETFPPNIWLLNGCVDVAIFNHFQIGASSIICEEEVEFGWREVEESVSKSLKTVSSADNPVGLKSWCASLYDTEVWEYHMVKLTLFDCHIFLFLLARQAQLRSMLSSSLGRFLIVLIRWGVRKWRLSPTATRISNAWACELSSHWRSPRPSLICQRTSA